MPLKERYAPLNHVDKVKLANHLDQLEIFVVDEIPTLIHNKAYLLPSQFNQNEANSSKQALITMDEK